MPDAKITELGEMTAVADGDLLVVVDDPSGTPTTRKVTVERLLGTGSMVYNVKAYGAVGDGTTDDTAAFQAAIDAIGAIGGTVHFSGKHLIDSTLTVKPHVTLKGPHGRVGMADRTGTPYADMAGLRLNSAATITLQQGAGIDGALIYRKGMTFPAADSSAFAGTAVTVAGDDAFVSNSKILGFDRAFISNDTVGDGYFRPAMQHVYIDCTNGVYIAKCYDISRFNDVHCWPFATVAKVGVVDDDLERPGVAFHFVGVNDWGKLTGCFAYGYQAGYTITNCNNMTLVSCGADHTPTSTTPYGFLVDGTSDGTLLIGCEAAAQERGFSFDMDAGKHATLMGSAGWGNIAHGAIVDGGDATILGNMFRDSANGVTINDADSVVQIKDNRFYDNDLPLLFNVANALCIIGDNDYGDWAAGSPVVGSNHGLPTIASATALALPANGSVFKVSGTTTITSVTGGYAGRQVTLLFQAILTFTDGSNLKLAGDFTTSADDAITLVHDGTNWIETTRSAN